MKALSKLSDEMNAEQFSDRLNAIYNELLNLLDVDRPRAQSLSAPRFRSKNGMRVVAVAILLGRKVSMPLMMHVGKGS